MMIDNNKNNFLLIMISYSISVTLRIDEMSMHDVLFVRLLIGYVISIISHVADIIRELEMLLLSSNIPIIVL